MLGLYHARQQLFPAFPVTLPPVIYASLRLRVKVGAAKARGSIDDENVWFFARIERHQGCELLDAGPRTRTIISHLFESAS